MEALRTQVDSLNWELQRLQVENRRLREDNPAAEERVDRGVELESVRAEVAEKTQSIEALERELADSVGAATEAGRRASEAEERVAELSARIEELSAANLCDDETTAGGGMSGATVAQLEEALQATKGRVHELERELTLAEDENRAAGADREAALQRAELERYRALEDERRKWETRESRLYERLGAVEEELRITKTSACDTGDNEHLREQLRTLTSDLNGVQSLVESLAAENSRLKEENERLDQENLSVRDQLTGLTRSQPNYDQRWAETDGASGNRAQLTTADREPRSEGGTRVPGGESPRATMREHYVSPSLGTLSQRQMLQREGDGRVAGKGDGGEQSWGDCEERPHSRDGQGEPTPAIYRTRHSTLVTRATRATGLDTLTTFSVNRPRTVTFEGPISPQPPGSMATTVSGVYRDRLASDPLCNLSQPPCPVSSVPPWHRPSVPVTDCDNREGAMLSHSETPVQFQPGNNTVASRAQCRSENTVYPAILPTSSMGSGSYCVDNTQSTRCGGASTHQRDNNLQGGIRERQGDSLYCENVQHPSTHYPLSQPQGTSVLLPPPVNNGVGCVLPARGVEGSHSASPLLTSPPLPPSGGTVTGNHVDRSTPSGLPPTQVPVGTPVAHQVNTLPVGAVSSTVPSHPGVGPTPVTTVPGHAAGHSETPAATLPAAFCSIPLMGQIPQIPRFTGEGRAVGESFSEWHEHFENVATLAGWNDHWRLVHLTSKLQDTAMAFYRSCSSDVRSKYALLVAAMKRRFTPIRLTAVQAQLFHNRQQQERETVDQFAQDLQKLYNLAYAGATSEGPQAERMGQTLLVNQFVTGLGADLKRKLIGTEGSLDELVLKARFEEAKTRELVGDKPRTYMPSRSQRPAGGSSSMLVPPMTTSPPSVRSTQSSSPVRAQTRLTCYNCGLDGHMARNCPYPRRGRRDEEARGPAPRQGPPQTESPRRTVSALVGEEGSTKDQVDQLSKLLQQLEEKLAQESRTRVLNSVAAESGAEDGQLGPSVTAKVLVNGIPTQALIDTGSPATVVSLEFVLNVFVKEKEEHKTPARWREETFEKFRPPSVLLKAYSGHKLNIISEVSLRLTHGSRTVEVVVLVQEGAPHELLLGTDVQSKLGFALVVEEETKLVDLLTGQEKDFAQRNPSSAGGASQSPQTPSSAGGASQSPQGPSAAEGPTDDSSDAGCTLQTSGEDLGVATSEELTDEEPTPFSLHPEVDNLEEDSKLPQAARAGVVRLLKAVKVPPGYQKAVRARICGELEHSLLLFTPHPEPNYDLLLPDGAIEGEGGSRATVILENHGLEPVHLHKGTVLGTVIAVEEVTPAPGLGGGKVCGLGRECGGMELSTHQPAVERVEGAVLKMEAEPATANEPLGELPESLQRGSGNDQVHTCPEGSERRRRLLEQLALQLDHLDQPQKEELTRLITSFTDIFALDATELGTTTLVEHVVKTGDQAPIRQPVRRMPFALREDVDRMVEEMLDQGVIRPSSSPWASPVVLVRKKDGGMRFCVDYRRLNHVTKLDEFPLPRIDDTLDLLAGAKYFTTLDLASGYWQVAMDPASIEKTAFTTYSGLYEFRKMPFGLVNAPATFQRLMEVVLSGLARGNCHVYLDDVLVFGRTLEEHNANLARVFGRIRGAGLRLKPKKCEFAQESVLYLGHVVSADGIQTNPEKLRAVNHYRTPVAVKPLRSFLGLAGYYRRFVPRFSKIASPLNALTRKGVPYVWTPGCQRAFEKLKELLTSAPLLRYPEFTKPFILETDASGDGLGAVLAQRQEDGSVRPIAYASRSLQKHEKNYGITELEGLGVVWAVKHFRPYLYGHHCTVFTDHEALKSLLNTPQPSGKLARWGMALQELDLKIEHRSGKHNANADALSRYPLLDSNSGTPPEKLVAVLATTGSGGEEDSENESTLASLQRGDAELAPMIEYLETGVLPPGDQDARRIVLSSGQYTLEDDILYHVEDDGTLRVVPPVDQRERLFAEAHGGKFGAHLGDAKVYSEIKKH